jgi:monoamine oxidase
VTTTYQLNKGLQDGLTIDVAVIGGGVSGLYSGWRLRTGAFSDNAHSSKPPDTHVFELSERLGGRLVTAFLEDMPHVRCELGGMRYVKQQKTIDQPKPGQTPDDDPLAGHQMVDLLGTKLGLTSIPFQMGDGNTLYYARRQRFRLNDIHAGCALPYDVEAWEHRKSSDDLFEETTAQSPGVE